MGMDPVNQFEAHEVTIQLSGQVTVQAFNLFQDKLRAFIADSSTIVVNPQTNAKLQVRVVRQAVRPTTQ